jgi:hypothetical protein
MQQIMLDMAEMVHEGSLLMKTSKSAGTPAPW